MSKILKRPMFRKGGKVEEGVMSLAAPRNNYQEGGMTMEEIYAKNPGLQEKEELYRAYAGTQDAAQARQDILSNLLIKGGLAAVSGAGAGKGTLGELATAFQQPTTEALSQMQQLKGEDRKLRTAALGSFLEGEQGRLERESREKIAQISADKMFASESLGAFRQDYFSGLGKTANTKSQYDQGVALWPLVEKAYKNKIPAIVLKTDRDGALTGYRDKPDGTIVIDPNQYKFKMVIGGKLYQVNQETLKPAQKGE